MRQRAREAGLCTRCCKTKPLPGFVICSPCKVTTIGLTRRRRQAIQKHAELQNIVKAHERAGDEASEHQLHTDAAQWYRAALNLGASTRDVRLRVTEKLAQAYFLGSKPALAQPFLDELANAYNSSSGNNDEILTTFCRIANILWVNARPDRSLIVLERAIKFIDDNGLSALHRAEIDILRVRYLHIAGRPDEALTLLNTMENSSEIRRIADWSSYCEEKGLEAALQGRPQEMHAWFKRALAPAKGESSPFGITGVWVQYSNAALCLGDIRLVKTCLESALRIARQHQMLWRIPYLCAVYADFLSVIDQHIAAREYLLEALAYDAEAPVLGELIVSIGLPIALHLRDRVLVERFERSVMQMPRKRGHAEYVNENIAEAQALLYASRGEYRRAQTFLHRALPSAQRRGWQCWEYALTAARYGVATDIPLLRRMLARRLALPHSEVVRACLSLFDGFVADRKKQPALARSHAIDAARQFDALHWYGYAKLARTLLPSQAAVSSRMGPKLLPSTDVQAALTSREREVAQLILRGLTNRAIADELNISPHTVDSHVNSIMNRLGIRSRYQLADIFNQSSEIL